MGSEMGSGLGVRTGSQCWEARAGRKGWVVSSLEYNKKKQNHLFFALNNLHLRKKEPKESKRNKNESKGPERSIFQAHSRPVSVAVLRKRSISFSGARCCGRETCSATCDTELK